MRIRSIKPEFWRSDDIARLSWDDRLLFIGLWSYVDDNGVGRDEERIIAADLFALDEPFSESSLRVHGGLMRLHAANLIERYEVHGKPFLHITTWDRHQKINRPSPGRYPLPTCGNAVIHDVLTEDSLSPHSTLSAGTGEQGNRGTGEQGNSSAPTVRARPAPRDPERDDSGAIIGEWIDTLPSRPPGRVIGQVAREVKAMLDEGIDPTLIRTGVTEWQRKGLHPSTLASVVHEVSTPHQRHETATDRARGWLELDMGSIEPKGIEQ